MQTTCEFLDAIKAKHGLTSDYQVAKLLKMQHQRISFYRTGKSRFDDDTCILVAKALDIEPGYVMACIAAERTKSEKAKTEWKHIAERFAIAAVLVAVVAAPFFGMEIFSAPGAGGGPLSLAVIGFTAPAGIPGMYIMSNLLSSVNFCKLAAICRYFRGNVAS